MQVPKPWTLFQGPFIGMRASCRCGRKGWCACAWRPSTYTLKPSDPCRRGRASSNTRSRSLSSYRMVCLRVAAE